MKVAMLASENNYIQYSTMYMHYSSIYCLLYTLLQCTYMYVGLTIYNTVHALVSTVYCIRYCSVHICRANYIQLNTVHALVSTVYYIRYCSVHICRTNYTQYSTCISIYCLLYTYATAVYIYVGLTIYNTV